ncbi:hypothetical protein M011DRAFT_307411 [Sporormia fimetaria CBS 119925]|uniref:Uncharacterized protein n=1 Tax=Sporormia fimetaria CBS 119925 TaxID=1340428 RepID=A0A6A6VI87_9PLEO|nr:hypothetical protein M011DRAFT_307411 [Sporormia fimetaria CBS 119925]
MRRGRVGRAIAVGSCAGARRGTCPAPSITFTSSARRISSSPSASHTSSSQPSFARWALATKHVHPVPAIRPSASQLPAAGLDSRLTCCRPPALYALQSAQYTRPCLSSIAPGFLLDSSSYHRFVTPSR